MVEAWFTLVATWFESVRAWFSLVMTWFWLVRAWLWLGCGLVALVVFLPGLWLVLGLKVTLKTSKPTFNLKHCAQVLRSKA